MKRLFIYYIAQVLAIFYMQAVPAQQLTPAAQKMDAFLTQIAEKNGFSGAVMVVRNDSVLLKKGYGYADREQKIPFTATTISTTGSVTKQFTGAAILKLEMMGKLKVTDVLGKYFPDAPVDKKAITLHQLLTHTAGFPGAVGDDYEPLTRDAFLKRAFETKLNSRPGEKYEYSNVGYSILAAIVELKSGMNYEQFLHTYLFKPAGMKNTGYIIPNWKAHTLAVGYRGDTRWGTSIEKPWDKDGPYWNLKGNGGILSNMDDLYRWHQALLKDDILDAAAKTKFYGRHVKEGGGADSYYGYGWAIIPTPRNTWLITHNGGNGIFFCDFLRYLDERVTIIYQTNAMKPGMGQIAFLLARTLFIPGFEPALEETAAMKQAGSIAEAPEGKLVQSFISAITNGEDGPLKDFINTHFTEALIKRAPMDERLPRLKRIGNDIKNATVEKVFYTDNKTDIHYQTAEGTLILGVLTENGKIAGLMIQN